MILIPVNCDNENYKKFPFITLFIIILCFIILFFTTEKLIWDFGFISAHPKIYTYITSMFLHGSWLHWISNSIFLFICGFILENILKRKTFLLLYLLCGIFSNVIFGLTYPNLHAPLIGASGAISGLMGLCFIICPKEKIRFFYLILFLFGIIRLPIFIVLFMWIISQFIYLFTDYSSHVAYMGHIGGFLTGMIMGYLILWYNEKIKKIR